MNRILRSKWFAASNSLGVLAILFAWLASHIDLNTPLDVWRQMLCACKG